MGKTLIYIALLCRVNFKNFKHVSKKAIYKNETSL